MEFGDLPLLAAHVATEEPKVVAFTTGGPTSGNKSRAGGTRTPDHWFWRPALYQTELPPLESVSLAGGHAAARRRLRHKSAPAAPATASAAPP
jgi:hypothetical protein